MTDTAVELRNVSKSYGEVVALNRLSLAMRRGEFVVLLGPSGSGKTTLLSILGGFIRPSTGEVLINGSDVTNTIPARRPTVTVFQDYALFPHMSVRENVAFGLAMRRVGRAERRRLADEALGVVGLEGLGDRRVHELSGGQRQRVALARAIVIRPSVLLLDEPLGALDVKIRRQMQDELVLLHRQLGANFIHVTHDQEEAMSIADTIVLLNNGCIEDVGPPERIYTRPASLFAASFMGDANLLAGRVTSIADGKAVVDTPAGPIALTGNASVGCKAHISIRPENVHIGPPALQDAIIFGRAKLTGMTYQGAHRRCRAVLLDREAPPLLLRLPPSAPCSADGVETVWAYPSDVVLIQCDPS